MDRTEMLARVEAHYRSFWRGAVADFEAQIADDFVDEATPPGTPPGRASVRAGSIMASVAFPDMKVTIEDSVVGANIVAVKARWHGTNIGPFMGRPASGKVVEFTGMVMWRLNADGRIDRRWTQLDAASVFRQIEG
jgi:steroid delta-isomerase-like uncharacterized protein